jgi:small subunit ribosomal protein S4e
VKQSIGPKSAPYVVTHDARTIRFPDPHLKVLIFDLYSGLDPTFILTLQVDDTVIIDIETGKITDYVKFDSGNLCMITGGRNMGRVGIVGHRERHPGSFDIVHVKVG